MQLNSFNTAIAVALCLTLVQAPARAAEGHAAAEAAHAGGHHKNVIAGFVGITGEERRERALTLGIEYERRLSELLGIGVGVERAFGDLDFLVVTVPVALHSGAWKFSFGPGFEDPDDGSNHFLMRLGAEYTFEVGRTELAPKLIVDWVDGDVVLVGGLIVGFGF